MVTTKAMEHMSQVITVQAQIIQLETTILIETTPIHIRGKKALKNTETTLHQDIIKKTAEKILI
ncbi:hypothetical protein DC094_19440 [Pelagibaculum spongiae]|uniref:Uncharacterized protein n=1 Tax=Pelagibaculum spongiae TaxID=2080658 RepID=A0A2V1GPH6_9GAMM|nr:hypothetical protein DC094_19440 [Pelagibaculum spongiae]